MRIPKKRAGSKSIDNLRARGNPLSICIAGKNRVAIESLQHIMEISGLRVFACPVVSDTGEDGWQPSFRKAALLARVPLLELNEVKKIDHVIFLSLEYDRIVEVNDFSNAMLLNVHFSLLPAYKGCYTSIWPLYFGEKVTGVTLHKIDSGIDTGDIIDQLEIPISRDLTARSLYEIYQDNAVKLVIKNINNILLSSFDACRQTPFGSSYYSRKSLNEISLDIGFYSAAEQIKNKVRALYFPEFQCAQHEKNNIASVEITRNRSTRKPGTVVCADDISVTVATIDFDVRLIRA